MRFTNHRWYVSIEAPSKWRPTSSRAPFLRQTRGFPTEIEAKQFAKAVLSDEMKVTAGTLNLRGGLCTKQLSFKKRLKCSNSAPKMRLSQSPSRHFKEMAAHYRSLAVEHLAFKHDERAY
jgi:hypothetical protein